ncbi:UNVERIFIED_CONTAM: hypothetical protein GTU68_058727 [Idotea baltica]|nr:hypothetical protein [Idotea baltica]
MNPYEDFEKTPANYVPLTPISFLKRAAQIFAQDEAVVYGEKRYNWAEVYARCRAVASEINAMGLGKGDTVAVIAPNVPEVFELHYALPMSGTVINTINTRLDPETVAYILEHGDAKLVFCDAELAPLLRQAGAYLMSVATPTAWQLPYRPTFLSVSPMFHCNGWNHPWAMAIVGAKLVFTRNPMPELIFKAIAEEGVTHFGGAPIVLLMLAESEHAPSVPYEPNIQVMTAGAPPAPAILQRMAAIGMNVMQVYGLTETYGHISHCLWRDEWDELDDNGRAEQKALQGVAFPMTEEFAVMDREAMTAVPQDGKTQGEIAIRGNTVMKGYFKDAAATNESFENGYFWSGDVAVVHPNGYVQVKDRLKDVIISGGENISSVEVEAALYRHPSISAAAVVAMPSEKWGESPCAFIELKDGEESYEAAMIAFAREHLAGFKAPKKIVFGELPKTATGKIQKFKLREQAKAFKG